MKGRILTVITTTLLLAPTGLTADHGVPDSGLRVNGGVDYAVTFNAESAAERLIRVQMKFAVDEPGAVFLSLPAWTPGSYSLDNFARHVRRFEANDSRGQVRWDKADYDTWRVYPSTAGVVTVAFDYHADTLDVGMAWATDDFAFFNGTNLFPYVEGRGHDSPATVTFHTDPGWSVTTGLTPGDGPMAYRASSYDELVDMPTVIGEFAGDSREIGGRMYHLAVYPSDAVSARNRRLIWDQIERMIPPMADVFGEIPWDEYTTLMVFDPDYPGGSALEHATSHLGVYADQFIGSTILASITAHEIFHAWNVKRLRPAPLWPYDYAHPQPTELLWVSEGITDYYADLALVRGGIIPPGGFFDLTLAKIQTVAGTVPVALEDASVSTWISPDDGTAYIYYPKGSLAGLALDVLIRDDSDNGASLDQVMRSLYEGTYREGEGFTEEDWWAAVKTFAPGLDVDAFHDAYIDGRAPFAWDEILPLAGLVVVADTVPVPRIGVATQQDSAGITVVQVVPGGAAADAGVRVGDRIVRVGDVQATDSGYGARYRTRYGSEAPGTVVEISVVRGSNTLVLPMELRFADDVRVSIQELPGAGEKADRIRHGILTGRVDP